MSRRLEPNLPRRSYLESGTGSPLFRHLSCDIRFISLHLSSRRARHPGYVAAATAASATTHRSVSSGNSRFATTLFSSSSLHRRGLFPMAHVILQYPALSPRFINKMSRALVSQHHVRYCARDADARLFHATVESRGAAVNTLRRRHRRRSSAAAVNTPAEQLIAARRFIARAHPPSPPPIGTMCLAFARVMLLTGCILGIPSR